MIEKRFVFDPSIYHFTDTQTDKTYCEYNLDEVVDLLNKFVEENEELKSDLDYFQRTYEIEERGLDIVAPMCTIGSPTPSRLVLFKENEQLKSTIKDVVELLSEEVDVFSDKATEHDINAYMELRELDNKDAYYMAISTKKAIKMLKELQRND